MPLRRELPETDDPGDDERALGRDGAGAAPGYQTELAELADTLAGVLERVDELSMAILREALAQGAQQRPEAERRLSRVRNALVRALQILGR